MLALPHHLDRQRTQNEHVDEARDRHRGHGQQSVDAVLWSNETRQPQGLSAPTCCQTNHHWQRGLQREVDGEDGGLQAGELGARQGAEGDCASDKRLLMYEIELI